ncbi:MAG: hypothetical protein P0Y53_05330 [Candidatus Pseudobacter hemicellulosilyticus]|uniref:HEPN domain-containing protein n=1 Tax=Candidatus Pseudobacter hemicellulosilyticus TaxID=3121375 RepID=A0AAJ6BII9_9BACT|nr:MAG: hypothetical protein P0Y53_05330 [Pseudobacter sp.]
MTNSPEVVVTAEWHSHIALGSVLLQGEDYLRLYKTAIEKNTQIQDHIRQAHIVNLAFALELLLKALHYSIGKVERGHNLNKLYIRLPHKIQKEIKKKFGMKLPTYFLPRPAEFPTFEEMLKQHANAYERWRYFHEVGSGSFNDQFCTALAYSIIEVAHEMKANLLETVLKQHEQGLIVLPEGTSVSVPIVVPGPSLFNRLKRGFYYAWMAFQDGIKER